MAISMMSMSAGAVTSKKISLHYTPMAPSSDNVSSQTLYFTTTQAQKYTVSTTVTSKLNTSVYVDGYVYKNGVWNCITQTTNTQTKTGTWYQISSGLDAKNIASISTSSSYSTNGYGYTAGW